MCWISSNCFQLMSPRECRQSTTTIADWACAESGDGVVPAHTVSNARFCRKHTRLRRLDGSAWRRWWCTEVVATSLGRAGRKREPEVPVPETTATFAVRSRVRKICGTPTPPVLARGGPDPFPDAPRPGPTRQAKRRSVPHAWPSHAGPPPSAVAEGPIHIRSNCPLIPGAADRCFAAACTPSLDRSRACPPHDRLLPASAILDCSADVSNMGVVLLSCITKRETTK